MSSPIVILNPVAGRGARSWPQYESEILKKGGQIRSTRCAGDARFLAKQAIAEGADLLVAAGGDGTLGEVVDAVLESQKPVRVAVLPIGTGNDFARALGVWADPNKALKAIFANQTMLVDVGVIDVNGTKRAFINIAGCGFDSLVAKRINDWGRRKTMRWARGLTAYLLATLRELIHFRSFPLKLELDGELLETSAVLCAVANAQSYGGGMKVCPEAELADGMFDVCLIQNVGRIEFLRAFPGVFAGKHIDHPKVTMRRCRSIRIESLQNLPVLSDGEIVGVPPFTCELLPHSIEFCVFKERG